MSNAGGLFSVVIASLCDNARAELLKRACDSVRAMAGDCDYSIIVVANGPRVSPEVLDWLANRPDVHVVRLRSGSHPLARRVGAELATSEFLAFLDDDDELMPNTLELKVAKFREHPEIDVLITDGWFVDGPKRTRILPPTEARFTDLIETLMRTGWGASSLTLRTRNIDLSVFDAEFRHVEWTLTALQLIRRYRFGLLDEPTYRYYNDTPGSLSKLAEHSLAAPEVWRRLSISYAGTPYEPTVRRRFAHACHTASWEHARQGRLGEAWGLHVRSLTARGGLRFLLFTRRLVAATLRAMIVGVWRVVRADGDRAAG